MPAAAVIPAPIADVKVVAFKKFVVECQWVRKMAWINLLAHLRLHFIEIRCRGIKLSWHPFSSFTVSKIECSKQAYAIEYISME